jgi:hypothetical protein
VNRVILPVPVTIRVREAGEEECVYQGQVVDASRFGLKIRTSRFFKRQTTMLLTLAFPARFREYEFFSQKYHTYAWVIHTKKYGAADFEIGVRLLHNHVPTDFRPFGPGNY